MTVKFVHRWIITSSWVITLRIWTKSIQSYQCLKGLFPNCDQNYRSHSESLLISLPLELLVTIRMLRFKSTQYQLTSYFIGVSQLWTLIIIFLCMWRLSERNICIRQLTAYGRCNAKEYLLFSIILLFCELIY
jgi:hypothetical protein